MEPKKSKKSQGSAEPLALPGQVWVKQGDEGVEANTLSQLQFIIVMIT